jgi:alkyl sulfatase BDS1-like metallo-beta-lactamase superfamily hydrolase
VVWDLNAFDFAQGPAPATVNPSLWRHAGLLRKHGLYQVAPKLWQVRGFDISNMTIIEGQTGLILIDPLTTTEVAKAALELARTRVGQKPVVAVIYTHSHADHFGGVKGVVDPADMASGKVAIIAPEGFMAHAVSENLIAGPAMSRRATFQFGSTLAPGPAGQMGAGIGMGIARGTISLIAPTKTIAATGETMVIDGLTIEFQVTPGTEAPAEMNLFIPSMNALGMAENANVSMHNILPPRGALVRDAKAWAGYLTQAIERYGARSDVMFIQHGWPRWGRAEIATYLTSHRDAYKYLHDQSVRMMNQGMTAGEIAETIALPPALANKWYNRGYYGTMKHNSRAVYQRYLGWYDANPVNLDPLPPEQIAKRYVAAMGGEAAALRVAQTGFDQGDYRWSAQVASHLVFANKTNSAARELLARSFEQMGYQAESMLWRNMYLTGAQEARVDPALRQAGTVSADMIGATTTTDMFDLLAIRVDPAKAAGKTLAIAFVFPDRNERIEVRLNNSVMIAQAGTHGPVQATLTLPRPAFVGMLFAGTPPAQLVAAGVLKVEGDRSAVQGLLGSLDGASTALPFPIVTP